MREYRGKRIDNGEWVEGSLKKLIGDDPNNSDSLGKSVLNHYIVQHCHEDYEFEHTHLVDPSTVGQYIEVHDDEGNKEMCVGDIVRLTDRDEIVTGVIQYCGGGFILASDDFEDGFEWITAITENDGPHFWIPTAEIIGSIHDNPELLEAE